MQKRKELFLVIKKRGNEEFLDCCGLHSGDHLQFLNLGFRFKKALMAINMEEKQ